LNYQKYEFSGIRTFFILRKKESIEILGEIIESEINGLYIIKFLNKANKKDY
jgi:hypothetical protein